VVWPARIRLFVGNALYNRLQAAAADAESPDARRLAASGIPPGMIGAALAAFGREDNVTRLAQQIQALVAIHETGHACGLNDHARSGNFTGGETSCPMRYSSETENMLIATVQMLLPQAGTVLPGRGRFCTAGDNCQGRFNVHD